MKVGWLLLCPLQEPGFKAKKAERHTRAKIRRRCRSSLMTNPKTYSAIRGPKTPPTRVQTKGAWKRSSSEGQKLQHESSIRGSPTWVGFRWLPFETTIAWGPVRQAWAPKKAYVIVFGRFDSPCKDKAHTSSLLRQSKELASTTV